MSKICLKCGCMCVDDAKFCTHCGNSFANAPISGEAINMEPVIEMQKESDISFTEAFAKFWQNYAEFTGRARRKEFWYVILWNMIIGVVIANLGSFVSSALAEVLSNVYALALVCPMLALSVRRLHDIGKSGFYLLFGLIPVIGWIVLLIFFTTDGVRTENIYGKNPKML